ncbi:MAG TPA: TadG family pilus assembly protein [Acetobacteraceae bacterium]|nr:TadG family pilus assembly protein [Acetobacteraceae bacterium]
MHISVQDRRNTMMNIQRGDRTRYWHKLFFERKAMIAVLLAVMFPVLLGFGLLVSGTSYIYYRDLLLRQTVNAAALAAATELPTYYTSSNNSTTTIVSTAQTFALANEPSQTYGTAVPASNVVVGNWNSTTSTFTSLASSGGTAPNAVQVTGLNTVANGNAVPVFFGGLFGVPTEDLTATSVASYATGQNFDTIIVNDLSMSFSSEIGQQRAADLAVLNCVQSSSSSASNFGITTIDGHSSIYQALLQVGANMAALQTKINALDYCGTSGMPSCSGSDIAAGLYSAIQQFSTVSSTNTIKNIIIITDGVPNVSHGVIYTTADGIYPTPTSLVPTCSALLCTDANLLTMAQNQASDAAAAGISVSTIYYSGDTSSSQQASYAASLAALTRGTGVALTAPTSATISTVLGGFCATMPSALKLVD